MIDLRSALTQSSLKPAIKKYRRLLSTGLSELNYALSGDPIAGIESASVVWLTGQSDSGRTTLALTLLAEAARNCEFTHYNLYYNDTEGKNPNIGAYCGQKLVSRLQYSQAKTTKEFWNEIQTMPRPFIYVLDSFDGIMDEHSYQFNNQCAKQMYDKIKEMDSILILTAQQKELSDARKVSAGGFALSFFADYVITTRCYQPMIETIKGKERQIGTWSLVDIAKVKNGAPTSSRIYVPIQSGYGIENISSLFYALRRRNKIIEKDGVFHYTDGGLVGTKDDLMKFIADYEAMIVYDLFTDEK
jgi:hypothetical protein